MLCATVKDEPRFRDLIGQWISEGSVPEFPVFVGESEKKRQSRKRRYKEEAKEAEEALREMGADTSECGMKEGVCILVLCSAVHAPQGGGRLGTRLCVYMREGGM